MNKWKLSLLIAIIVVLIAGFSFHKYRNSNSYQLKRSEEKLERSDNSMKLIQYIMSSLNSIAVINSTVYHVPCESITGKYTVPLRGRCFISSKYGKEIIYSFSDVDEDDVDYLVNTTFRNQNKIKVKKISDDAFELKLQL